MSLVDAVVTGAATLAVIVLLLVVITAIGSILIMWAHPPAGRLIDIPGSRLHVVETKPSGEGAADDLPLVLIHGTTVNLEDLRLALGAHLGHRRAIFIDRPGHGWSGRIAEGTSPARQAAAISAALERLGIARAIILGHSYGGAVATAMALDDPARVAALVLVSPASHPHLPEAGGLQRLFTGRLSGPLLAWTVALPLGCLMIPLVMAAAFAPQRLPTHYVRRAAMRLDLIPANFLADIRGAASLSDFLRGQVHRYPQITAPTVILAGYADLIVPPYLHARALAAALPRAKLAILPGIGHMLPHIVPARVAAAVEEIANELAP